MSHEPREDVTVLRTDASISNSFSGEGSGEADAPRVLKQRFVLEEKLGSGGMGTVFRAKDLRKVEARDRQPYLAIKVLNNDFREHPEAFIALQREAAKSQILSHPNIVSIYDFDKDGDVPFMTMELLEGQELAELLRAYPNGLPEPMAWAVIRGICAGLAHAHEAGIVHADFKPGNVYVAPSNAPKILDFGIARAVQLTDVQGDDTLFDPARLAALTPAYASREMLAGDNPEPRDDLYSLGIVIYLILTGHHPYGRLSADQAATEGLKADRPKSLTRRQWQVVNRCLAFNRQDRPESIAELEKYLLAPSPWGGRIVMGTAAAALLALSINFFIGDAELKEVKQEVRQTTLLDAQLERLDAVMATPDFDMAWEQSLSREYEALVALGDSGTDGVDETDEAAVAVAGRIRESYAERIRETSDADVALGLLNRGSRYGPMAESAQLLEGRLIAAVRLHLDQASAAADWVMELDARLLRFLGAFPESAERAAVELEAAETLEWLVRAALEEGDAETAERLLSSLQPKLFDDVVREDLLVALETVEREAARAAALRQQAALAESQARALKATLEESCLRLDLDRIETLLAEAVAREQAGAAVSERLGDCVGQLAELDPDRARVLELNIAERFADFLAVEATSVDPCSLSYLVGNGAQSGRQGYCVDDLDDDPAGRSGRHCRPDSSICRGQRSSPQRRENPRTALQ
ncbi:MAG: protein kinase, partial [Pseudomonadota bacterium]